MRAFPAILGALGACLALGTAAGAFAAAGAASNTTGGDRGRAHARQEPFQKRPFPMQYDGRWIGDAVAYGPHRDGQRPNGPSPSVAELRQDLDLMVKRWHLLRLYGSAEYAEDILKVIRAEHLDMKVMLGISLAAEDRRDSSGAVLETFARTREANRREVEAGLRLADGFPEIVKALCVGNETQIFWSGNRVPTERLIEIVREVRARSGVPITVSDDFNYWNKPESRVVAREIDFISSHHHPLWNGSQVQDAMAWVRKTFSDVQAVHPGDLVLISETGWATQRLDTGDQGKYMKGRVGEDEQAVFCDSLGAWLRVSRVPTFTFEAFDENWKGSDPPGEVEKHWGLYRADRTPKKALSVGK